MQKDDRFIRIYSKGAMNNNEIWVDRETGELSFPRRGLLGRAYSAARSKRQAHRHRRIHARTLAQPLIVLYANY